MAKPGGPGKGKKKDGEEEEEVDDNNVKNVSLDFECGQRILAEVQIRCQVRMQRVFS